MKHFTCWNQLLVMMFGKLSPTFTFNSPYFALSYCVAH
ncbi:MAG: hypothetical protein ACRCZY_02350 [Phocaeicola sp.]